MDGKGSLEKVVTSCPLEACRDPSATPAQPTAQSVHSPRTQSSDMAEEQASFCRASAAPPHPAAPSFLSAGAAAAPAISPTGLAAPHGPRCKQRSAAPSDQLQFSPSQGVPDSCEYPPAGRTLGAAARRHR